MKLKLYIVFVITLTIMIGCAINSAPPSPLPVTIDAIENAMHARVDGRLIADKIRRDGVDFLLTEENKRRLKKAKVDKIVMNAIKDSINRKNNLVK